MDALSRATEIASREAAGMSTDMDDEGASSDNVSLAQAVVGISPAARVAHARLEMQQEDIKNGKHEVIRREVEQQEELKQRRVATCEEQKAMLHENAEQLRIAEVRDSDIQTKVDMERTQEELLDDVHQRIRKAKVDGELVLVKESVKRAAGARQEEKACEAGDGGDIMSSMKKRPKMLCEEHYEVVTPEAVLAKAEARRIRSLTLSDIEMRRDFQAIIMDWRERAKQYLATYNNSHWTKVTVYPDSFRVRNITFSRGDPVVVTSRVTGEEFHGEITVIKPKAIFLSLYGGVKTRIFVDHISTGRLDVQRAEAGTVRDALP